MAECSAPRGENEREAVESITPLLNESNSLSGNCAAQQTVPAIHQTIGTINTSAEESTQVGRSAEGLDEQPNTSHIGHQTQTSIPTADSGTKQTSLFTSASDQPQSQEPYSSIAPSASEVDSSRGQLKEPQRQQLLRSSSRQSEPSNVETGEQQLLLASPTYRPFSPPPPTPLGEESEKRKKQEGTSEWNWVKISENPLASDSVGDNRSVASTEQEFSSTASTLTSTTTTTTTATTSSSSDSGSMHSGSGPQGAPPPPPPSPPLVSIDKQPLPPSSSSSKDNRLLSSAEVKAHPAYVELRRMADELFGYKEKLKSDVKGLRQRETTLMGNLDEATKEVLQLRLQIDDKTNEHNVALKSNDMLSRANEEMLNQSQALHMEKERYRLRVNELEVKLASAEQEKQAAVANVQRLELAISKQNVGSDERRKMQELEKEVANLNELMRAKNRELNTLQHGTEQETKRSEEQITKLKEEKEALLKEVSTLKELSEREQQGRRSKSPATTLAPTHTPSPSSPTKSAAMLQQQLSQKDLKITQQSKRISELTERLTKSEQNLASERAKNRNMAKGGDGGSSGESPQDHVVQRDRKQSMEREKQLEQQLAAAEKRLAKERERLDAAQKSHDEELRLKDEEIKSAKQAKASSSATPANMAQRPSAATILLSKEEFREATTQLLREKSKLKEIINIVKAERDRVGAVTDCARCVRLEKRLSDARTEHRTLKEFNQEKLAELETLLDQLRKAVEKHFNQEDGTSGLATNLIASPRLQQRVLSEAGQSGGAPGNETSSPRKRTSSNPPSPRPKTASAGNASGSDGHQHQPEGGEGPTSAKRHRSSSTSGVRTRTSSRTTTGNATDSWAQWIESHRSQGNSSRPAATQRINEETAGDGKGMVEEPPSAIDAMEV